MHMCAYCWMSGVEANYNDGDVMQLSWSYRGSIVNSYFSNTYRHGGGGTTDGDVFIIYFTSAMLVQNNIPNR